MKAFNIFILVRFGTALLFFNKPSPFLPSTVPVSNPMLPTAAHRRLSISFRSFHVSVWLSFVDARILHKTRNSAFDHWGINGLFFKPRWNWKVLISGERAVMSKISI
jgi:hypothetical protein